MPSEKNHKRPPKTETQLRIEQLEKSVLKLEKMANLALINNKKLANTNSKLQREVKRLDADLKRTHRSLSQEIEKRR